MPAFQDKTGATWAVQLSILEFRRIKEASGGKFDFAAPDAIIEQTTGTSPADVGEFWELLWYTIEPQAVERGVTAEEFAKRMASRRGLLLLRARQAFWSAWANFTPDNPVLRATLAKLIKWQVKAVKVVTAQLRKERSHGRTR